MGYVIIPKPHFSSRVGITVIVDVLAGRGHLVGAWRSSMTAHVYRRHWVIQVNNRAGDSVFAIVFGCFSRIQKMLSRTETRTRERKRFQ